MKVSLFESQHPFFTCLLLAFLIHLIPLTLFSLTMDAKSGSQKPLMTFLGSILKRQDFDISDKSLTSTDLNSGSQRKISFDLSRKSRNIRSHCSMTKPLGDEIVKKKGKPTFKPPKQFYLSDFSFFGKPQEEYLGINMEIPLRTPLKLDTP